jgi:hypothetical protein
MLGGNTLIMHQTIKRQMTDAERQRLLDCMPLAPSPFRPFHKYKYGLQVIGETFGVLMLVVVFVGFGDLRLSYGILGGVGFLAVLWLLNLKRRILTPLRRWRDANRRVWAFHSAVAVAQAVRVHCVEADGVVQVTHKEGTICLFDVGQSQTYWIDPYCMIPGHPSKDWPNRKFEVVEIPGWKEEVGPFCDGKRLRPRETVEFRDLFEHYDFEPPEDGLIHQALDSFLTDAKTRNRSVAGIK